MTISSQIYDMTGNQVRHSGVTLAYDTMTNVPIPAATQPSIVAGTGAPTFTAPKGTLYTRLDGGANTRLYINSDGATTWGAVTTT